MKKRSFIAAGLAGVIFCCLAVVMYIRLNDTKYASEREALMGMGLSSEEATELAEIGAIIRKLEAEKLTIIEKNGIYQVVDEGDNVVKKTAGIEGSEINYIIKKIQDYKASEPIAYEKMLRDVATLVKEKPEQGKYRVTYENGSWLEVEILCESADEVAKDDAAEKVAYNDLINAPYPNEVEISRLETVNTPGFYESSCELRLYTGLYYIQNYLEQSAEFSDDMESVAIKSAENVQVTAGVIKLADSSKYVNVTSTEKGNSMWCQVEGQDTYRVSAAIGVPLSDPFSATPTIGHNWTRYTVIKTSLEEMRLYGAYYSAEE